jgi:arginyl-tRNA synthetase
VGCLEKNSPLCVLQSAPTCGLDLCTLSNETRCEAAGCIFCSSSCMSLSQLSLCCSLRLELACTLIDNRCAYCSNACRPAAQCAPMMRLPEGKMSTRKGRVVFLEDVLDRAVEEARRIIAEKNPNLADAKEIAEQVGVGAVVFNDLKRERVKDVEFVWEEVLSFEGETGPYVQYTHARLGSILRKAAEAGEGLGPADLKLLEEAGSVLLALGRFPAVLRSAADHAEPSEITAWLLSTCRDVNNWYAAHRVLGQDPALTAARLRLVRDSKSVIANGLRLLGVAAPEEM